MPDAKHSTSETYLFHDWPDKPSNVSAVTTLRANGFSQVPYDSFNLASHVNDDEQAVSQNRRKLMAELALPAEPLWLEQVHGKTVHVIEQVAPTKGPMSGPLSGPLSGRASPPGTSTEHTHTNLPCADASLSRQAGRVCAVLTADCLPVFLCDQDGSEVAVAHAGWRGLHAGVITRTVAAIQAPPGALQVYLGPAIGPQSFEVGQEVYAAFVSKHPDNAAAFTKTETRQAKQHYLCDIYELARQECLRLGVASVSGGNYCTFSESHNFFSFRRNPVTGRMANLIWQTKKT